MCMFGGKPPKVNQPAPVALPAPPPPPEKTPEGPTPDILKDKGDRQSVNRAASGASGLRIPLNVPGSGKSGLNI